MKKTLILILLLCLSVVISSCNNKEVVIPEQPNCTQMGYISIEEANALVNVTNKLIDISNVCFSAYNISQMPYLKYYEKIN